MTSRRKYESLGATQVSVFLICGQSVMLARRANNRQQTNEDRRTIEDDHNFV